MNSDKRIKLYIKQDALEKLEVSLVKTPPKFKFKNKDGFYFILDLLFRWRTFGRNSGEAYDDYLPVSSLIWKYYLGKSIYKKYLNYLIKNNVIKTDNAYSIKKNICIGYKISEKLKGRLIPVYILAKNSIGKKIIKRRNESNIAEESHVIKLKEKYNQIEFNYEAAKDYLNKLNEEGELTNHQFDVYEMSINRLRDKDFTFKRNKTNNRLDTNLTNIKAELRNFIKGNKIQMDLKNSQPYLLNYILNYAVHKRTNPYCGPIFRGKKLNPQIELLFNQTHQIPRIPPLELEKYRGLTRSGMIYETFKNKFGLTRDEAKQIFLATLYSKNNTPSYKKYIEYFKIEFPAIFELLYALKEADHRLLPISLQGLEAEVFIDNIAKRLVEENKDVYTVHDSIIIKEGHQERAFGVIEYVFQNYFGEVPAFEIKKLAPEMIDIEKQIKKMKEEKTKLKKRAKKQSKSVRMARHKTYTLKELMSFTNVIEEISSKSIPPILTSAEQKEFDLIYEDYMSGFEELMRKQLCS